MGCDFEMIYGYVRVSTKEQNEQRQVEALINYGVEEKYIKIDKASGKNFNREKYQLLKNEILRTGDTLVIKELDRLGRNMDDIKKEWQDLIKMGIDIEIIDTPILNTGNKTDLEKNLISNIVFELLSYMAEKERIKIRQRQREGIDCMPVDPETGRKYSKKTGKVTGRPVKNQYPKDWEEKYKLYKDGVLKAKQMQQLYNWPKSTFYYMVKQYEENKK